MHVLGLFDRSGDFHRPSRTRRALKNAYRFAFDPLFKGLLKIIDRNGREGDSSLPRVIYITRRKWRMLRDYETGKLVESDFVFDPVVTRLKRRFDFLGVYYLESLSLRKNLGVFKNKRGNARLRTKPLNLYWSKSVRKAERLGRNKLRRAWKMIINDSKLRELCKFENTDYYAPILNHLEYCFLDLIPMSIRIEALGENMLSEEKADIVLLEYEYGPARKSLGVLAPRKLGLPSVALQHGNIFPAHPGYFYHEDEIFSKGEFNAPLCHLPDITCVYGEACRRILVEQCGYPAESVAVTGQPRYDIFYRAGELFSKSDFRKKHSIKTKNRIILWTTQSQGLSDDENLQNIEAVAGALKEIENVTLVVKQHPNEGEKHARMIRERLDIPGIDLRMAPRDSDTFEQLYACDLMITKFSTTATEAVALGKPVLILNLSGEVDRVGYVEEGVALGVYRAEDLRGAIAALLESDSQLTGNRREYIESHIFYIDGKSADRVGDVINQFKMQN